MGELSKKEKKDETRKNKKVKKQELKVKKLEEKKVKQIERKIKEDKKVDKEIVKLRKRRIIIETVVVVAISLVLLLLLCNRTFFREEYKTNKVKINIPLLTFFVKDDGEKIVLKTLRKSDYVKEYFEDELANLVKYNCNMKDEDEYFSFYYDEGTRTAIYDVKVEKMFAIKTITIYYGNGSADTLCSAKGAK